MLIKLLQWNVWYVEKIENIAKEIKRINPDVICAQEFIQNFKEPKADTAKYLAEQINYSYFYKEADNFTDRPEKDNQGNAIFSKFPLLNKHHIFIQDRNPGPKKPSTEGRIYMEASINVNNHTLTFSTTHLSYSSRFEITQARKKETDRLVNILKERKNNFIFTGDFNSPPNTYPIDQISKYLKNAGPDFSEKTWTTKPFDKEGFVENDLNWRLDYVFATNDVNVKSAKIIETPYSDHLPILVEIEV